MTEDSDMIRIAEKNSFKAHLSQWRQTQINCRVLLMQCQDTVLQHEHGIDGVVLLVVLSVQAANYSRTGEVRVS